METFVRDGLVFDVHDSGTATHGTVVALHGFPQTAAMWNAVRRDVVDAGYRFVAPDQRGYSPGARPPGIRPYAQQQLVDDAVALIEALDVGPVHLVGHDWGGAAAWGVASQRPELLHSLTVLSTPHPVAYQRGLRGVQGLKSWYFLAFQVPRLPELFIRSGGGTRFAALLRGSGLDGPALAPTTALFREPGAATAAVNWYRALRYGGARVGRITVPTLYVWGDRDRFLGGSAIEATGQYVTGPYRFERVAGGTHWLADERPGQIAEFVLERLRGAADPASD